MTTILKRCLYLWILLWQLTISRFPVDKALLDVKQFSRPEYAGASYHMTPPIVSDNSSYGNISMRGYDKVAWRSVRVQLRTTVEKPITSPSVAPTSLSPSQFYRAVLIQEYFGIFSNMIIGSQAIAFTVIEILLLLFFWWRKAHAEMKNERTRSIKELKAKERMQKLQECLEAMNHDWTSLKERLQEEERQKLQFKAQAEVLEEKLQVLDQLCLEKDYTLQQKLIQDEADQQDMERVLSAYDMRIQELRQEKQSNELYYRGQIDYHQKRAFKNLMNAHALEQCLELERRETGRLRQLLEVRVTLNKFENSC